MFCRKTNCSTTQPLIYFGVLLLLLAGTSFQSCQPTQEDHRAYEGKWKVVVAYRNGQSTSTLEDAYFDFASDSTFVTNIFEHPISYDYERTPEGFKQLGSEEIDYIVDDENPDTLYIQTTFKNYHFSFVATKDTTQVEKIVQ